MNKILAYVRKNKEHAKGYIPKEYAMGIQVEMEHTSDPAEACEIAREHLDETKNYYTRHVGSGLVDEDLSLTDDIVKILKEDKPMNKSYIKIFDNLYIRLEKAGTHKYIKKIERPGKTALYFYTKQQVKDYKEKGIVPEQKKETKERKGIMGAWSALADFFGITGNRGSDETAFRSKIQGEYSKHKDKLEGADVSTFAQHLNEFLANKEKWLAKLSGVKKEKAETGEKKEPAEKKEKAEGDKKEKSGQKWNLNLMRSIAGIYGGKKEGGKSMAEKTMKGKPVTKEEIQSYLDLEKQMESLKDVLNYRDPDSEEYKKAEKRFDSLEKEQNEQVKAATQSYGITADDFISQVNKYTESKSPAADNFESMPEGRGVMTSEKFKDELSKIINGRYSAGSFSEKDGIHVVWGKNKDYNDWEKIRVFDENEKDYKIKEFSPNDNGMKDVIEYVKKLKGDNKDKDKSPLATAAEDLKKETEKGEGKGKEKEYKKDGYATFEGIGTGKIIEKYDDDGTIVVEIGNQKYYRNIKDAELSPASEADYFKDSLTLIEAHKNKSSSKRKEASEYNKSTGGEATSRKGKVGVSDGNYSPVTGLGENIQSKAHRDILNDAKKSKEVVDKLKKEIETKKNNLLQKINAIGFSSLNEKEKELAKILKIRPGKAAADLKKETEKGRTVKDIIGEGYWNGKLYGDEKYGHRIYVDNKEKKISKEDALVLKNVQKQKEEKAKEQDKVTIASKKDKDIQDRIDYLFETRLNKNIDDVPNKQMIEGIKKQVSIWVQDKKDSEIKKERDIDRNRNNILRFLKEHKKEVEGIKNPEDITADKLSNLIQETQGWFDSYSIRSNINELERIFSEEKRNAEQNEATIDDYQKFIDKIDDSYIDKFKEYFKKKKEKTDKAKEIKEKIIGKGKWNGKVYGKSGSYSIYISGDKKEISDADALELKKLE